VKVETTVTFNVTFDEEINEAYENNVEHALVTELGERDVDGGPLVTS
jgi:hypothetical protein